MTSAYQQLYTQLCTRYEQGEAAAIARWAVEDLLGLSLTDIYLGKDKDLSAEQWQKWQQISQRLAQGEPIQYVLGHAEFCGLSLEVNSHTLIPRPETEDLVAWVLTHRHRLPPRIADIGTGSGCIALALKAGWPTASIRGGELSTHALATAQRNAKRCGVEVDFSPCDLLSPNIARWIPSQWYGNYVLVSNPPYICGHEKKDMEAHVLDYEPHSALFVPDNDPLLFYKALAKLAKQTQASAVACEINTAYGPETAALFPLTEWQEVSIVPDRFERPRFVVALRALE